MTPPRLHRTTIDIEIAAFDEARRTLGTRGYKETVNEALRQVSTVKRLRHGASLIREGELGVVSPEQLSELRSPRS